MKAIILAGGRGERLRPITDNIPKSLVEIAGKPLIEYQIDSLRRSQITDIVLVVGYLGSLVKKYLGDGSRHGVRIQYFTENRPLGTAGALAALRDELPECFLVMYGDLMLDVDFWRIIRYHYGHSGSCTIAVHPNDHPADSDIIVTNHDGVVTKILPKRLPRKGDYPNCVNAGVMVCSREAIAPLRVDRPQDIEVDILAPAMRDRRVHSYLTPEYIKDMGTPQRLAEVARSVQAGTVARRNLRLPQKAIFLDRDGTINDYVGLLHHPGQLSITEGVYKAIRAINASDYLAIVISNQSVVARNLCTMRELHQIHWRLETMLGGRGAYLDRIYFCPHHQDAGFPEENKRYKVRCLCRKPGTGMIGDAVRAYGIEMDSSYLIGDTTVDIQTGKNAGLATILLRTGEGGLDGRHDVTPDFHADSLQGAVQLILSQKATA
jgi:histidinol-phosphate phosphatase family protein